MLHVLNRMKITTLLQVGFAAVLAMAALMTGVGVLKLREMVRLGEQLETLEQRRLMATNWRAATELNLNRVLALAKSGAHEGLGNYLSGEMTRTTERINGLQAELEKVIDDPEQKAQLPVIAAERHREKGKPDPASSVLKIKGSEIQQLTTELLLDVVGPYAMPYQPEPEDDDHGTNEPGIGPDYAASAAPTYFNWRKVSIYGGSNEIQRNIIAKAILGL